MEIERLLPVCPGRLKNKCGWGIMNENIFENPEGFDEATAFINSDIRSYSVNKTDPQFLDVKELNDLLVEYRLRLRAQIAAYRSYKTLLSNQRLSDGVIRKVYASYEGIFQRRRIADLWKVYRILSADCHDMTQTYLANLHAQISEINAYRPSLPTEKTRTAA